ncbi:MAG: cupin domain-containing protein [Nocardiopsaceae bacterium]|nr:cupin domain-containing protein [Nocardiopsaceae bacterium]
MPDTPPTPHTDTDKPRSGLSIRNLSRIGRTILETGVEVFGADALGVPVHSNGHLGCDVLRVPPHGGFPIHTHPGDHLLLCLDGEGSITLDGVEHTVTPGDIYMIPGAVPHAVGAGELPHVLLAVGAPHKPVASPERMTFTDWAGVPLNAPLFPEDTQPEIPRQR